MNSFSDPPVAVNQLAVGGGTPGIMTMLLTLTITNPSTTVSLWLPYIYMDVYYNDTWIGHATIYNFTLLPGIFSFLNGNELIM